MEKEIKKRLGEALVAEEVGKILKNVFSVGDCDEVSKRFVGSFRDQSTDALIREVFECRLSKERFAKWIFSYMDANRKKLVTNEDVLSLNAELGNMTGIACKEETETFAAEESEFIEKCKNSAQFERSWLFLRKITSL